MSKTNIKIVDLPSSHRFHRRCDPSDRRARVLGFWREFWTLSQRSRVTKASINLLVPLLLQARQHELKVELNYRLPKIPVISERFGFVFVDFYFNTHTRTHCVANEHCQNPVASKTHTRGEKKKRSEKKTTVKNGVDLSLRDQLNQWSAVQNLQGRAVQLSNVCVAPPFSPPISSLYPPPASSSPGCR